MCGLFGMAGNGIIKDDLEIYYELGIVSQLRGEHSAGYFEFNSRTRRDEGRHFAEAVDFQYLSWNHRRSSEAIKSPSFRMLDNTFSNVFLGHTRYATVGDVTDVNAQPMMFGDYVVCHNGTLKQNKYHRCSPKLSDSYMFAREMSERGIVPVLDEIRDNGAYALVVFNKKAKRLFFARNQERTLYFAINQKRSVLYWASERWMLTGILGRCEVTTSIYEDEKYIGEAVFPLSPGIVWSVNPLDIKPKDDIFQKEEVIYFFDKEKKKYYFRKDIEEEKEESEKFEKKQEETEEVKALTVLQPPEVKKDDKNIVPFDPPLKKVEKSQGGKDFSVLCSGCGRSISVYNQYQIRKGEKSGYNDLSTGKYWCECVGSGALKESLRPSVH